MRITRRNLLRFGFGTALLNWAPGTVHSAPVDKTARQRKVRVLTGAAFGSAWRLVVADTRDAADAGRRVETVVTHIDRLMSPYRPESDLGRFNARGSAVLAPETRDVTVAALLLAEETRGAFDPTLAPIGRRYGFGPLAIAPDRLAGCFRELRLSGNRLETRATGLTLDLCALAKGYALDEILRVLDGLDFLIELGGEVAARGRHPENRPWRVGIERPLSYKLHRAIYADRRALATSGDAAQGYTVGSRRYAPVLDPRRRAPVDNGVASVSVLAQTGMMADALATAAMVLGPAKARSLLDAHGASALFLVRRPRGSDITLEEVEVNGFLRMAI